MDFPIRGNHLAHVTRIIEQTFLSPVERVLNEI